MPSLTQRLQNAWNAFRNPRDPTFTNYGLGTYYRPDRHRFSHSNERSIVTTIFNRIAVDCAAIDLEHVRLDEDGRYTDTIKSGLNDCLTYSANIDQTGKAFIEDIFPKCPNISIDYGIMEKAENVFVLPSSFGWSDLGTWGSLYELSEKDEAGNVSLHSEALFYEANGNVVTLEPGKLAVVQGVDDMIIAEQKGVLLVCKKAEEQRIKQFVADAKNKFAGQFN